MCICILCNYKKVGFSFLLIEILNTKSTRICNFFTYLNEEALYFCLEHTKMLEFDINIHNIYIYLLHSLMET
jgi:hypothetical protein